jgi:hypothetical protein
MKTKQAKMSEQLHLAGEKLLGQVYYATIEFLETKPQKPNDALMQDDVLAAVQSLHSAFQRHGLVITTSLVREGQITGLPALTRLAKGRNGWFYSQTPSD